MNILIVDDELGLSELLADILAPMGHRVTTATNGAAALATLDDEARFDLILLDVMMPVMSGEETLQALAAREDTRDIAVVMMSSAGPQSISSETRRSIAGFLPKPFTIRQLEDVLAKQSR